MTAEMCMQQEPVTVNIEEIMEEIRADIQKRKLDGTLVPFEEVPQSDVLVNLDVDSDDYDEAKIKKYLDLLNKGYMVILDRPFSQGSSKAGVFVKKAVRRLTRFYINPVVRDQNSFNAAATNALHQMNNRLHQQQKEIHELRKEVNALKKRRSEDR